MESIITFGSTLKNCLKLSFQASKFYTIIRIITGVSMSIMGIMTTVVSKSIIDKVTEYGDISFIMTLIFLFVLIGALSKIMELIKTYVSTLHDEILKNKMNLSILKISSNVDLADFDSPEFNNAFEKVKRDIYFIPNITFNFIQFVSFISSVLGSLLLFCRFSSWFGIALLIAAIPTAYFEQKYTKELYSWDVQHTNEERKLNYISFALSQRIFFSDIRLYNMGLRLKKRYLKIWEPYFNDRKKISRKKTMRNALVLCIPDVVIGMILINLVFEILAGKNTIGDFALYSGLAVGIVTGINISIISAVELYEKQLMVKNLKDFMNSSYQFRIRSGIVEIQKIDSIEFKNVCFTYPHTNRRILDHLNLKIDYGDNIGMIGLNGAGKSTLVKLLMRFYDVDSGNVLINDIDIKEYHIKKLRSCFSTFFQEFTLFSFSLKDNIAPEKMDVPEDISIEVLQALGVSQGEDIKNVLTEGVDTYLTKGFDERGIELSKGQMQKIALARAFYRNGSMIILDEPSSSLDPEAEFNMFRMMKTLCRGKTTLFITHRMSNVRFARRIVVLENGKIIEDGSHEELLKLNRRYAELYQYQNNKND